MADTKLEVPETNLVGNANDDDLDKASDGLDKVTGGLADDEVNDVAGGGWSNHNETFLAAQ